MPKYTVEVLRTVACSVEVQAADPSEAADKVDRISFPIPPVGESEVLDGCEYIVYRADAQGVLQEVLRRD